MDKAQAAPFAKGDVFAGVGGGTIKVFSSTGTLKQTLTTAPGFPTGSEDTGMGFDSAGNLYATLFEAGAVAKFDSSGTFMGLFASGISGHPESVAIDKAQNIYIGVTDSGLNQILKYNTSGTLLSTYVGLPADRGFDWIDLAADQKSMHYTGEGTNIRIADITSPPGTFVGIFASGLGGTAYAHRILADGSELLANSVNVLHIDAAGNIIQTNPKPLGETSFLFALNLDPDGTSFWTGGYSTGNVYEINIATGALEESFNAGIVGGSMAGLAVFGEITSGGGGTVPIPTTIYLLGSGLAALGAWRMKFRA